MEGHTTGPATHDRGAASAARLVAGLAPRRDAGAAAPAGHRLRDLGLLALLLAAAVALRAWHVRHTEVAARDTIGYVRYAWQLKNGPLVETLRNAQQHPGYPAAILAMSYPVRHFVGGAEPAVMQLSAQLVSSLAGALLVVPMFYLGRELFSRSVGFGAALLFQCLPAAGRVLPDGLSESLFLFFLASGLLTAVVALRRHSVLAFALCGLFGGLAYLVRPEGALVVGAASVVLLAAQCRPAWRTSWRRVLACGAALSLAALATGGPLVAVTGKVTVKNTGRKILAGENASLPEAPGPTMATAGPSALPLAIWWREGDGDRRWWGVRALGHELMTGSFYVLWVPALLGLWWFRDRFRLVPGSWVLLLVCLVIAALLWRVASGMGYLSDRHALTILLCGSFWAAAALPEIARRLRSAGQRIAPHVGLARLSDRCPGPESPLWAVLLFVAVLGAMLPRTLEPLHVNRKGFRFAGHWLAEHAAPWDEVIDPYCWTHYHAGKVFQEGTPTPPPPGVTPVRYVVLEVAGLEHSRLPLMPQAHEAARRGREVFRWTGKRKKDVVDVVVYAVPVTGER
jgi:hypothetical protein